MTNNIQIPLVILSCDRYEKIWKIVTERFQKYWHNYPYKKYICTNKLKFESKDFINLNCYPDVTWSNSLYEFLKKIDSSHIFLVMDDTLVTQDLNISFLSKLTQLCENNQVNHVQFFNNFNLKQNNDFEELPKKIPFRANVLGLWNRAFLMNLIQKDENPWEFEVNASYRCRSSEGFYFTSNFFSYVNILEKGKIVKRRLKDLDSETGKYLSRNLPFQNYSYHFISMIKNFIFLIIKHGINYNLRVKIVQTLKRILISY